MSSNWKPRTLLIVDDEPDLQEILAIYTDHLGYRCLCATHAKEALRLLAENEIHAVLSDIMMPGMSGIDFLRTVRASGSNVPFIFLTGFPNHDNMLEALQLGAYQFLAKPFKGSQLKQAVERALDIGVRVQNIQNIFDEIKSEYPELLGQIEILERNLGQIQRLRFSKHG